MYLKDQDPKLLKRKKIREYIAEGYGKVKEWMTPIPELVPVKTMGRAMNLHNQFYK